jgi:hypothetical protein
LRRLSATFALAAALALPAAAQAGVYTGEVIDGPSADIVRLGEVDVARDGTGGVVYLKRDGGVDHVFIARLVNGAWQPPERVDAGLTEPASEPVIAASDGGRLAVAFVSGQTLYALVRPGGAPGTPAPQPIGAPARAPSIDMSIHGAGYLTYTSGADVRAARLERTEAAFGELGAVLDVDPNQAAGDTDAKASDVSVSADGTGIAVWGESHPDGRDHVYARRLYTRSISTFPQDLNLPDYQGRSTGSADHADMELEDDSSYGWIVYRQIIEGMPRAIARRILGSQFEAPNIVDPLPWPTPEGIATPELSMNGTGAGLAASVAGSSRQVYASHLDRDAFNKAAGRVDSAGNTIDPRPKMGMGQNNDGFITWLQSTGAGDAVGLRLRLFDDEKGFAAEQSATNFALGAVDTAAGYDAAADRANDAVIVAVQQVNGERRLVATMHDREPGFFAGYTTTKVRRFKGLSWAEAFDLWGLSKYTVILNNLPVAETTDRRWNPPRRVGDGVHRWRVIATDRRGQTRSTRTRILRVDNTKPRLRVRIFGTRKAGSLLRFRFTAGDVQRRGASGLARIRIVWGDGSRTTVLRRGKRASHRYRRGRVTVRVSATDRAGNAAVVRRRLTIGR